jgi:hypothetical protein
MQMYHRVVPQGLCCVSVLPINLIYCIPCTYNEAFSAAFSQHRTHIHFPTHFIIHTLATTLPTAAYISQSSHAPPFLTPLMHTPNLCNHSTTTTTAFSPSLGQHTHTSTFQHISSYILSLPLYRLQHTSLNPHAHLPF